MKNQFTPWRVQPAREQEGFGFQVWTALDNTPGSRNNFIIADDIQSVEEANLLASAPMLLEALVDIIRADDLSMGKSAFVLRFDLARAAIAMATGEKGF